MFRNLEAEIKRAGMTYGDMSQLLKCDPNTFSRKVNGKAKFTLPEAYSIKKILLEKTSNNYPLEYLFDGTQNSCSR